MSESDGGAGGGELKRDPGSGDGAALLEVCTYFVRERNALLARAEFSELFTDYYLHLMQHELRNEPVPDQMLKDGLAAITLHLASRPWKEVTAWTINFPKLPLNLFVTGDSLRGRVSGRAFTEDVKDHPTNLFYSQVNQDGVPHRQSTVEFSGDSVFAAVEHFYAQSEGRPARYFHHAEEDIVMVSAQPQCDIPWLESLDDDAIRNIDQDNTLSLLERRSYRFECGCDLARLVRMLCPKPEMIDHLFGEDDVLSIGCPRCGARFRIDRETAERALAEKGE